MKFFINATKLNYTRQDYDKGVLEGVTTTPSLMAKEGVSDQGNIIVHY